MTTLTVPNIDDALAQRLRRRARLHGVSDEQEAWRTLSTVLGDEGASDVPPESEAGAGGASKMSFAEFLVNGDPAWPEDFVLARSKDTNEDRRVEF